MRNGIPTILTDVDFGDALLLRNPWLRWLFTPLIVLFAVFVAVQAQIRTVSVAILVIIIESMCVSALAGSWLPDRYAKYAFRSLAALIFVIFAFFLIDALPAKNNESLRVPILGLLFPGLPCLWYAIVGKLQFRMPKPNWGSVVFNDESVTHTRPNGATETVRWDELLEVGILTTDQGPYLEDVFYVLLGPDEKSRCSIAQSADGSEQLLQRLQQLPGFDNGAVINAMTSVSNAAFVCWRRGNSPPNNG